MREQLFFNPVYGSDIQFRMTEAMRDCRFKTISNHFKEQVKAKVLDILSDILSSGNLCDAGFVLWDDKFKSYIPARIENMEEISVEVNKSGVDGATLEISFYYDKEEQDEVRTLSR